MADSSPSPIVRRAWIFELACVFENMPLRSVYASRAGGVNRRRSRTTGPREVKVAGGIGDRYPVEGGDAATISTNAMERPSTAQPRSLAVITNGLVIMWSLIMVGVGLGALGDWHYHADDDGGFVHTHSHLGGHRHSDDPGAPSSGSTDPAADTVDLAAALAALVGVNAPVLGLEQLAETPEPARDTAGRHHGPSRNLHLRGPPAPAPQPIGSPPAI